MPVSSRVKTWPARVIFSSLPFSPSSFSDPTREGGSIDTAPAVNLIFYAHVQRPYASCRKKQDRLFIRFTKSEPPLCSINLPAIFTLKLSQKFNFQSSITKPDYKDHPIIESGQI